MKNSGVGFISVAGRTELFVRFNKITEDTIKFEVINGEYGMSFDIVDLPEYISDYNDAIDWFNDMKAMKATKELEEMKEEKLRQEGL